MAYATSSVHQTNLFEGSNHIFSNRLKSETNSIKSDAQHSDKGLRFSSLGSRGAIPTRGAHTNTHTHTSPRISQRHTCLCALRKVARPPAYMAQPSTYVLKSRPHITERLQGGWVAEKKLRCCSVYGCRSFALNKAQSCTREGCLQPGHNGSSITHSGKV